VFLKYWIKLNNTPKLILIAESYTSYHLDSKREFEARRNSDIMFMIKRRLE
jgi:hypothetical protein